MKKKLFYKELHYRSNMEGIILGGGLIVVFIMIFLFLAPNDIEYSRLILVIIIFLGIPGLLLYLSIKSALSKKEIILDDRYLMFRINEQNKEVISFVDVDDIYYKPRLILAFPYGMDNVIDIFYNKNGKLKCLVLSRRKGLEISELNDIVKILLKKNPNIKFHKI